MGSIPFSDFLSPFLGFLMPVDAETRRVEREEVSVSIPNEEPLGV